MALGTATKASGFNSLAMMRQSAAEGEFSTALGTASWANGNGSFAMGYSATAKTDQSIAIGAAETIKFPGNKHGYPSAKYNGDGNTVTEGARSLAFGTKALYLQLVQMILWHSVLHPVRWRQCGSYGL